MTRGLLNSKAVGSNLTGLISAVPYEADIIIKSLGGKTTSIGTLKPLYGSVNNRQVVYISSGIGAVNSAMATALLVERYNPSLIINFGIGGAYPSSVAKIGDVVIAETEIYADAGVFLEDGIHPLSEINLPTVKKKNKEFFNEFPMDKKMLNLFSKISLPVHKGVFLTVSAVTGTSKRAKELKKRFDAICENMEGAGVAQACAAFGVRMVELRGVSNIVEDRNPALWDKDTASHNCQNVLLEFLSYL